MISDERKAKAHWHCRRGMLELDVMLARFFKHHKDTMTEAQFSNFELLLTEADPDLYAWLMGYETPTKEEIATLVTLIRSSDTPQPPV